MPDIRKTFARLLNALAIPHDRPVAVACSGGADSMALALLAHDWAKTPVTAITVDHGLRPGSAREALQVKAWLGKRGIRHVTLAWKGEKPAANIQEEARKARYRLMAEYCSRHGIAHLLVAHTLEDQAETFLLRLARGSGVDGLSAMAPLVTLYGVQVVRPLLAIPKTALLDCLNACGQPYAHDPGNDNTAFDRVRVRQMMPELRKLGLTPERLAATAANMARARAHMEEETGHYLAQACTLCPEGYAVLRRVKASREIALRALSRLIMTVGGLEKRTRLHELERLHDALTGTALRERSFKGATLGGCVLKPLDDNQVLIFREMRAAQGPVFMKPGMKRIWDNRFEITLGGAGIRGLRVGALGQEGWLFCVKHHGLKNAVPDKRILYALPALRDRDGWLYAVPHLGLCAEGMECEASFIRRAE